MAVAKVKCKVEKAAVKKVVGRKPKMGIRKTPKTRANKTVVAFVLDCSGSMNVVRHETLKMLNGQVATVKAGAKKAGQTRFGLTRFNTTVELPKRYQSVAALKEFTSADYVPDGWTAMNDAIALTIDKIQSEPLDDETAVLMIILTDGMENASQLYPGAPGRRRLADKMRVLQDTGRWTFTFLGANIDVKKLGQELAIPEGNLRQFVPDSAGVQLAAAATFDATQGYFENRARGVTRSLTFYDSPDKQ